SADPLLSRSDLRVELGVRTFEVSVGDEARSAVPGARDVQALQPARPDEAVQVHVDEVQSGRRPPVAEEPGFDVLGPKRLAQERVRAKVDLADREVVRGPPVTVDLRELV